MPLLDIVRRICLAKTPRFGRANCKEPLELFNHMDTLAPDINMRAVDIVEGADVSHRRVMSADRSSSGLARTQPPLRLPALPWDFPRHCDWKSICCARHRPYLAAAGAVVFAVKRPFGPL